MFDTYIIFTHQIHSALVRRIHQVHIKSVIAGTWKSQTEPPFTSCAHCRANMIIYFASCAHRRAIKYQWLYGNVFSYILPLCLCLSLGLHSFRCWCCTTCKLCRWFRLIWAFFWTYKNACNGAFILVKLGEIYCIELTAYWLISKNYDKIKYAHKPFFMWISMHLIRNMFSLCTKLTS